MSPERWRQIEELYHAALELDAGRRASFLAQACQGDEELHREVESLLAQEGVSLPDLETRDMLAPGTRVGAYRIEAAVGQGGMGVVYRALDSKLNRQVALKFLSDELADATARRRFQREAQMASSLNHPHIVTVHDTGEFEDRQYLVTEFVDGGTLYDWVRSEQRTWQQIVELLVGVADALATAHDAGILHRDIKPANILVTKSGYAKLADFGLAKLAPDSRRATTQTLTAEKTRPGIVVGTIAYMSPEQASGRPTDSRSDIFSFGVVLYELIAGRRPFVGATDLELLQRIVHGAAVPLGPDVVPGLRMVLEKALEKDPAERYQSIRELVVDLRRLSRQSGQVTAPVRHSRTLWARPWRGRLGAALIGLMLIAGFVAWRAWRVPERAEPLRAIPLVPLPGVHRYPTFSPDGNHVAFSWNGSKQDNPDIYVQQIGAGSPLRLTSDPGNDYNPVWSPDGRFIAFLRSRAESGNSELRLIAPLGGTERKLADIRIRGGTWITPPYLTWCPDSNCFVVTDSPGEGKPDALFVISLETGEKTQLTHPQPPAAADTNPAVSPDGSWLVFRRTGSLFSGELYRLRLRTGSASGAGRPQGTTAAKLTAAGEPQRLTDATLDANHPTWMPDSKEILFSVRGGLRRLAIAGESGPARLPFVGEDGLMPVVSRPQPGLSSRLVYVRNFEDDNIWRIETSAPGATATSAPSVFIASTRGEWFPQFSPNGRRLAFSSDRTGEGGVWVADRDGSNAVQLANMGAFATGAVRWSPDGERIVFHSNPEGQPEIYLIPAAGGKPRNLTSNPATDAFPNFSRDGKWVYFTSNRRGEYQIWKMPASGGDAVQVTDRTGYVPFESPDGAWLYFVQTMERPSPLWRIPASGGDPVKVLEGVVLGNFAVREAGIYYIDRPAGEAGVHYTDRPSGETRLQYFDLATRRVKTVARDLGNVDLYLTASPDGRTILYSRVDSSIDDLMLVENFR